MDIREDFLSLALSVTTQVNLSMVPRVNVANSTMTSRLREIVGMNPPLFLGYNVGEDSQKGSRWSVQGFERHGGYIYGEGGVCFVPIEECF